MRGRLIAGSVTLVATILVCPPVAADDTSGPTTANNEVGIVVGAGSRVRTGTNLPGFWGIFTPIHADLAVEFEDHLNEIVLTRIWSRLAELGYEPVYVRTADIEWNTFSDLGKSPKIFDRIVERYGIEAEAERFERLVVVEYMFEPRLWAAFETIPPEELTLEKAKPKYANAKIWMFDTATGKQLYRKFPQKAYTEITRKTVEIALEESINLSKLPPFKPD